jgi:hypothetical protein
MAALLLARLLTRPDMAAALSDFMTWQQQALAAASAPSAVFLLPGILHVLALIFKLGRREQLLPLAPVLWQQLAALLAEEGNSGSSNGLGSNALARKLAVKLTQRLGLVLLPPQLAGWRYIRAAADLGMNLGEKAAAAAAAAAELPTGAGSDNAADKAQEEQQLEIAAEIEEILGVLLASCADRDTVVRWSAAKGVGRLAGCLPQDLAEEVVDGALALLCPSGAGYWWLCQAWTVIACESVRKV